MLTPKERARNFLRGLGLSQSGVVDVPPGPGGLIALYEEQVAPDDELLVLFRARAFAGAGSTWDALLSDSVRSRAERWRESIAGQVEHIFVAARVFASELDHIALLRFVRGTDDVGLVVAHVSRRLVLTATRARVQLFADA